MILIDKNTKNGKRQIPSAIGSEFNLLLKNGIEINGKISSITVQNACEEIDNICGLGGVDVYIDNLGKRIWTIEVEDYV